MSETHATPGSANATAAQHRPGALERLKERGFFAQCTDEARLRERLDEGPVTFYVGVDPTGSSLHVGHLIPLYALAHLSEYGHNGIVVVGGGTARIGDPSGKSEMRQMITVDEINTNATAIGRQIAAFLGERGIGDGSFDAEQRSGTAADRPAAASGAPLTATAGFTMVNNAEWLAELNYIEFLRDIGRHFSVNRMLTFETYRQRMETGLSFIEFNYQLLQSYDFLKLYQTRDCRLQIGGDDQWGNIVAGTDLIRRVEGSEEQPAESFGLTFPLVTRADGKKMGKTEKGAVFLDATRVSPYDFYQYWRNVPDADVRKFLYLYTFLPTDEIEAIVEPVGRGDAAGINAAKERLAVEITRLIHGADEAEKARDAARALFSGGAAADEAIPGDDLPREELERGINALDLFVRSGLCGSKSEARRLVQQGGARINDTKVADVDATVDLEDLGGDDSAVLLLRAGKKRHFRYRIV